MLNLGFHQLLLRIILFVLLTSLAEAQSIPYRDGTFRPGMSIGAVAPKDAVDLISPTGASVGKVWFEQWKDSVVVFGSISPGNLEWARFPLELQSRAHVNLWLATAESVPMPEIGWGSQFGLIDCAEYRATTVNPAEDCDTWSARQVLYREQLRRLFVREWQIASDVSTEVFATAAYRQVLAFATNSERDAFSRLEPKNSPIMEVGVGTRVSGFQIAIPPDSLPPTSTLELGSLRLVVELADGEKILGSTSPAQATGDPSTFRRLVLARPIRSRITSCDDPLTESTWFQKDLPAWYLHSARADTMILANVEAGYRYAPTGLSPFPIWTHHFTMDLGNGNVVCGPHLRFVSNGKRWEFDGTIDENQLKTLQLTDGSWILKSGPTLGSYSPFGSGRCGACATWRLSMFHLDPGSGITRAFSGEFVIDNPEDDGDIQISTDWKTIIIFRGKAGLDGKLAWTSERFCLSGTQYASCGAGSGPPPEPRQISRTN